MDDDNKWHTYKTKRQQRRERELGESLSGGNQRLKPSLNSKLTSETVSQDSQQNSELNSEFSNLNLQ